MELSPVVKWVGGKRQILPELKDSLPAIIEGTYFEPFLGGGALWLALAPQKAVVNDLNAELVNLYSVIRDNVSELLALVSSYSNEPDVFYELRALDRDKDSFLQLAEVERAARTLFLNRAGYNGLYRVNSKGEFNSPYGWYKKLSFDESNIRAVSEYLQNSDILLMNKDYRDATEEAKRDDFVYLDPPYDPISPTSSFTSYNPEGFARHDQEELFAYCRDLDRRGVRFMQSNSNTPFIRNLYKDFHIKKVMARRSVNSVGSGRSAIEEVLITNYAQ